MGKNGDKKKYAFPTSVNAYVVKGLRDKLNMTQSSFADVFGVSRKTVERWEKGEKAPNGAEAILFDLLTEHPEYLVRKEIEKKSYPMRLYYMYFDKVCAVIDVDERNRRVQVTNYTDMVIYRPFGSVQEPDYDAYEEFLESRCFPRSRDKVKLQLAELDLPFYDPILIIEKTEGRMEEDDFWIAIER